MTGMTTASTNGARAAHRTPSVSELQAALVAARSGQFATTPLPVPAASPAGAADLPPAPARLAIAPPAPVPTPPPSPGGAGVWLLGTHGGSGVQCLAAVLPGARFAGKTWPTTASSARELVVLVCRGNHRGLSSAQEFARTYRDSDLAAGLQLLGVIISADAPGRIPPPLRRLERLLSGAVPVLGHVPWEPNWRLGPPQTGQAELPPWVARLGQALSGAAGSAVPA